VDIGLAREHDPSSGDRRLDSRDVRIDRALVIDVRLALRSRPIRAFLALEGLATLVFVARRGVTVAPTVTALWLGLAFLAFVCWWAGRHRAAHPEPDPMTAAGGRTLMALVGVAGLVIWGYGLDPALGAVLTAGACVGWLWVAARSGGLRSTATLTRDPRPFVPLLLLIALPRLWLGGLPYLAGAIVALPSGIGQQLFVLVGLFAPLEAALRRTDASAIVVACLFGLLHVPFDLEANDGDWLAAAANAILVQASVGAIACLAFVRHRAVVPIGVAHGLAIG
jgi:hypothetical protein